VDASLWRIRRPVEPIHDEPGKSTKVFTPRIEHGQAGSRGGTKAALLVERDRREAHRRRRHDVGRRILFKHLKPRLILPREHDLVLHTREGRAAALRPVAERGGLSVGEHSADLGHVNRGKGSGAWLPFLPDSKTQMYF